MRSRPPAMVAVAAALSLGLLAIAACSGGGSKRFIPPPPGTVATITTAPPGSDFTGVALTPVEGRVPAEKVEVVGGDAVLSGVIAGPDGPVGGATVRLERFVGDAIGKLDILSNADGSWRAPQTAAPTTTQTFSTAVTLPGQLPPPTTAAPPPVVTRPAVGAQGVLGGRYRIRAWKGPDLALTTPQILFVEAKQPRSLTLQLSRYTGITVGSLVSPDPPILDAPLSVTAIVSSASVDGDGVVRAMPLANATVSLSVGPGLLLVGGPTFTNPGGRATFQLRCVALGQSPVNLSVNGQSFSLPVKACQPVPTTTSTLFDPTASSSSSIPGGGTSSVPTTPPRVP